MKKQTKLLKRKYSTGIFMLFFMLLFSWQSKAQTSEVKNPILEVAPNLPKMIRATEGSNLFYGAKFTYDNLKNKSALKQWSIAYPEEVTNYKVAIAKYLEETNVSTLTTSEQDTFYDLKSQWLMSMQIIN